MKMSLDAFVLAPYYEAATGAGRQAQWGEGAGRFREHADSTPEPGVQPWQ